MDIAALTLTCNYAGMLKRLVRNPSNPKLYAYIYLFTTFFVAIFACLLVHLTVGFGVSVSALNSQHNIGNYGMRDSDE